MSDQSAGEGWWLASDGQWYPPVVADADATVVEPSSVEPSSAKPDPTVAPAAGWWLASDGNWYAPAGELTGG